MIKIIFKLNLLIILIQICVTNTFAIDALPVDQLDRRENEWNVLLLKNHLDLSSICARWFILGTQKRLDTNPIIWQRLLNEKWNNFFSFVSAPLGGLTFNAFCVRFEAYLKEINDLLQVYFDHEILVQKLYQRHIQQLFLVLQPKLENYLFNTFD